MGMLQNRVGVAFVLTRTANIRVEWYLLGDPNGQCKPNAIR